MRTHFAALAVLGAALAPLPAFAQAPGADVQALLAQVGKAYKELTAFSATIETTSGAGEEKRKVVTKLVLHKPNKLSAMIESGDGQAHVVADGKFLYADNSKEKTTYLKQQVGDLQGIVRQLQQSGGAGIGLLPILLLSDNAEQQIVPGKPTKQEVGADETIDGVPCDILNVEIGSGDDGAKIGFAFGKQDHLLRRLSFAPIKAGPGMSMVETHTGVSAQPAVTEATYAYTPPAGAKAIDKPVEPPMFDPRVKKGAAPLPFKGNDLAGTPVSLAAYKGKVVLLDFWATWCGPCVAEAPNVVAAYKKYHAKGFDVIGVSLDNKGDKAKLMKFTKDNKMPWRQVFDGKGWESSIGKAWGVMSIPFTVLLGKDGKIAAVGVRGPALEPAIKAALAK